jgi:probable F420-dependent oxidoreductase
VVAAPTEGAEAWRNTARRAEQLGYSTLLAPDNLHLVSPTVSLAVAASVTTKLRVGTFVYASPLRTPRATAWEAHSLSTLTEGRFELGLGTGLPTMKESARELGLPYGSGPERLTQIRETIDHLHALEGSSHTPVLVAAMGPKALALAAEKADIVTLNSGPLAERDEIAKMLSVLREHAGKRIEEIELSTNIFVVGDEIPASVRRFIGVDVKTLAAHKSLTLLRGTHQEIVDELQRRREELGISYVSVNGAFLEQFAPIVETLTGK